jgi:glutamyl-tRNA synthetase
VAALRQSGRRESHRLLCPDGEKGRIDFNDLVWGPQSSTLTSCGGDFVIRRSDGVWAYQLAVVCDDIAMGINQVTRGCDILASTPRQLLLYRLFRKKAPQYAHVPLLCDGGGERLAKRHKSLSLDALRRAGCTPESIVGWLACKAGLQETSSAARPQQLAETLRVNGGLPWHRLRQERITVTDALQQEWLS